MPASTLTFYAPAKVNLFLAVTGRRPDGFHEILSVAAKVTLEDRLTAEPRPSGFTLACDDPTVPSDGSNLVLKASDAFARATGWTGGAHFSLEKRIPWGAGLGGASSDAAAALRALNALAGEPLAGDRLRELAASVGSDCPLFLADGPVVMRGRGELLEPLPKDAYARIRGMRLLILKPAFPVPTPWAYGQLAAAAPASYVAPAEAQARLTAWLRDRRAPLDSLLFNSMERAVFSKYAALPVLMRELEERFGLHPRMSGSGSALFAVLNEEAPTAPIEALVRDALGAGASVAEARIA